MAAWGAALESRDEARVQATEDRLGRFAIAYVAVKAAAARHEGGAEAVELTVALNIILYGGLSVFPGIYDDYPDDTIVLAVPTGRLGPALVDAGLATEGSDVGLVPVSREQTIGRIEAASAAYREHLRARAAWTCRAVSIERTILPTEPALVRAAQLSTFIFASWLRKLDAAWVVRATCADGPGLFVVTGHHDARSAATVDLVLGVALAPPSR